MKEKERWIFPKEFRLKLMLSLSFQQSIVWLEKKYFGENNEEHEN